MSNAHVKPGAPLTWPTKEEYDLAMQQWNKTLLDPELQRCDLARTPAGVPRAYRRGATTACVYKLDSPAESWMARCFCSTLNPRKEPTPDVTKRYAAIARFYEANKSQLPALTPIFYQEQGIMLGGRARPVVKMQFLRGSMSFGSFLNERFRDANALNIIADGWRQLARDMERARFAHGDLDLTNVMVQEQPGNIVKLRLVDYDNVYIPELNGLSQNEFGHEPFQHPAFLPPTSGTYDPSTVRPYNAEMDRFSLLVIYISLRALIARPGLYTQWQADESEKLLLSQNDYRSPTLETSHIMQVKKLGGPALAPYIDELIACLNERRMPKTLDEIGGGAATPGVIILPSAGGYSGAPSAPIAPPVLPLTPSSGSTATGAPPFNAPRAARPMGPGISLGTMSGQSRPNQPLFPTGAPATGPAPATNSPTPMASGQPYQPAQPNWQPSYMQGQQPYSPLQAPKRASGAGSTLAGFIIGIVVLIVVIMLLAALAGH